MAKQYNDRAIKGLLLLRNGLIWDRGKRKTERADILIKDGIIDSIGIFTTLPPTAEIVDITGCTVIPGLLDIHVHLREPGYEDRETIATGCAAAAAGGFTAVCCMPNTNPVADNQEVIQFIKDKAQGNLVTVYPVGAVSKSSKGDELAEIGFMIKAGIVAISDDGMPVKTSGIMRRALEYSRMFNIPVLEHPQDTSLTEGGSMNEGLYSTKLGIYGMPSIAEDIIVSRDMQLLEYIGGQLHIQHVSSAHSVELIRQAKDKGLPITAEATPHHFTLTDAVIESFDPNYKMNPPLRSEADREAIVAGLKDGTIDAIATDHSPHTVDDKEGEFDLAKFGVTGLETAVGAYFTELVDKHQFNGIETLVELCVINPRKIMRLDIPEIQPGALANVCILNEQKQWTVKKDAFFSKAMNSCFIDKTFRGYVIGVIGNKRIWLRDSTLK
jgi:dihydroorotase